MKKISALFLFIILGQHSFSQAPNWLWAIGAQGGTCYTDGQFIYASASTGDLYFSGRFAGTITLGGKTISVVSGSSAQGISGKITSSGNAVWLKQHEYNGGNDYNYAFAKDDSDNTVFGGIISSGGGGGYIDKYDSAGTKLWSSNFAGASPYGLATDKAGNIYVTGDMNGTVTFGTQTMTSFGGGDIFLVKYSPSGVCLWAKHFGGSSASLPDGGRGVVVDRAGNIYVSGSYNGTATFGTLTPPAASGYPNFFIAKCDSVGTPLWVNTATNAGFGTSYQFWNYNGMTIDSCSNIYLSGHFVNTAQFGSQSVTSAGSRDLFVAKCLNSGTWEWVKSAGGAGDDDALGIVTDRYNDLYVTGSVTGTAQFGSQTLTGGGAFLAKYANSTGDLLWVQKPTGGGGGARSLTIDKYGYLYMIGTFSGTQTFGPSTITCTNTCSNGAIFIAKLDTTPPLNIIPYTQPAYCSGLTVDLPYSIVGSFNPGNIFTAQLSDATGSFVSPVNLGSVTSTTNGNISITIPPGTPVGNAYVIRILSSNPAYSSHYLCSTTSISPTQTSYNTVSIGSTLLLSLPNDTSFCTGSAVQLNVTGTTYAWSPDAGLSCTNCGNPTASPSVTTTYTVEVNSGLSCSASDSIVIIPVPGVTFNVIPDTSLCPGSSVSLNPGGSLILQYNWIPANGLSCTNCANPLAAPTISTTYSVSANNSACSGSDNVVIQIGGTGFSAGIVSALRDTICSGTPGSLSVSGSFGDLQWESSVTGLNFSAISGATTDTYLSIPSQTTYYRIVAGNGSCSDTSAAFELVVAPSPVANFEFIKNNLVLTFTNTSQGGTIYNWDFGDNTTSHSVNPKHGYPSKGVYHVCLTVFNGSNCSFTICKDIDIVDGIQSIKDQHEWTIYPSPFSDFIFINGEKSNKKIEHIELYDVLGRMVFLQSINNTEKKFMLDFSRLHPGIYSMKIITKDAAYFQRIMKQ